MKGKLRNMNKSLKYSLDIQRFAVQGNTTLSTDLAPAISIDVTTRFNNDLDKFAEVLGVSEVIKVNEGFAIQPYTAVNVTLADGDVDEGDVIPLSKATATKAEPIVMQLKKYRKLTTAEAIGKVGFDRAINKTDEALVREVYKDIRTRMLSFLETGTGTATGTNLQKALAQANAQVAIKFEDDAAQSVAFINPQDLADYLGETQVQTQTLFGLTYLQNFLGFNAVIVLGAVPKGTVYATAVSNLELYAIDMANHDLAKAFELTSAKNGFIGLTHGRALDRASIETLVLSSVHIAAERLDGVVKATIVAGA